MLPGRHEGRAHLVLRLWGHAGAWQLGRGQLSIACLQCSKNLDPNNHRNLVNPNRARRVLPGRHEGRAHLVLRLWGHAGAWQLGRGQLSIACLQCSKNLDPNNHRNLVNPNRAHRVLPGRHEGRAHLVLRLWGHAGAWQLGRGQLSIACLQCSKNLDPNNHRNLVNPNRAHRVLPGRHEGRAHLMLRLWGHAGARQLGRGRRLSIAHDAACLECSETLDPNNHRNSVNPNMARRVLPGRHEGRAHLVLRLRGHAGARQLGRGRQLSIAHDAAQQRVPGQAAAGGPRQAAALHQLRELAARLGHLLWRHREWSALMQPPKCGLLQHAAA